MSIPAFMRNKGALILGLQTMALPVNMLIGYAYGMQISEASGAFRNQPDWTKKRIVSMKGSKAFGPHSKTRRFNDRLRRRFRKLRIEALEELAEPIHVSVKPHPLSSDPKDDMILDVAINGRADALVTQNPKHFKEPGN